MRNICMAHDCHQNVTEHSTTSGHTKCTHSDMLTLLTVARVTNTGAVSQAITQI